MRAIETVHAEPRDTVEEPVYRVNFWQSTSGGWALDAFVLTDVKDIKEVLRWVDDHTRGRLVEVFVEVHQEPVGSFLTPRKTALVRLLGIDPNRDEGTVASWVMTKD